MTLSTSVLMSLCSHWHKESDLTHAHKPWRERIKFCREGIEFCRGGINFCREGIKFCHEEINFCRVEINFCRGEIDFCRGEIDFCRGEIDFCRGEIDFCRGEIDFCRALMGHRRPPHLGTDQLISWGGGSGRICKKKICRAPKEHKKLAHATL